MQFDVGYTVRQCFLLTAEAFFLALAMALLLRRRYTTVAVGMLGLILMSGGAAWLSLRMSARVYSGDIHQLAPMRVGPSAIALQDLWWFFVLSCWLPALLALGASRVWPYLRAGWPAVLVAGGIVAWTGLCEIGVLSLAEYGHEDTVSAEGFTLRRWDRIRTGMTRREVEAILGPPLGSDRAPYVPAGSSCWAASNSAGYSACLTFVADTVAVKSFSYST